METELNEMVKVLKQSVSKMNDRGHEGTVEVVIDLEESKICTSCGGLKYGINPHAPFLMERP